MRKIAASGILFLIALSGSPPDADACRFWGLIGAQYPADLISDHLRDGSVSNLEELGGSNTDGWGIGYFISPTAGFSMVQPIVRRGGPRANHPSVQEYRLAVEELRRIRPRAALGHVRAASSGHVGVPDPHPFQHEGILFAHNGTISEDLLLDLLLREDPAYLDTHPPDWTQGYIDSELYFLYLLKYVREHPRLTRTEAFRRAIRDLSELTDVRLNFVMTEGDTLWALRCAPYDIYDAVQYCPNRLGTSSSYWAVASQPLGSHAGEWAQIPARTLAVFVPGSRPLFVPIDIDGTRQPELQPGSIIGSAQPNPSRGEFTFPLRTGSRGGDARIEVWDVQGRSVWTSGPLLLERGENLLRWDGRDAEGRAVRSGIYFCRILTGSEIHEERIHVIH